MTNKRDGRGFGVERSVKPLTQALEDENENVRRATKEALEKIKKS